MPRQLSDPIRRLSGVGPRTETRLARLGIETIEDLLFHLPVRYLDRTRIEPLGALREGSEALVEGCIELTQVRFGRRRSLLCRISDGTGSLLLRFFHFNRTQQAMLERGTYLRCWGSVRRGVGMLEMIHPEYQRIDPAEAGAVEETLTPVYPATEGLAQATLRRLTAQALDILERGTAGLELVPSEILRPLKLTSLRDALLYVHRPPVDADTEALQAVRHPAQRRLAFEELLAHQASLRMLRRDLKQLRAPPLLPADPAILDDFIRQLPFRLTPAQQRVITEVGDDLSGERPMLRLVQGDVGSGKTVVAAWAALRSVAAGRHAALMAPTELLAEQHVLNLGKWLAPLGVNIVELTGSQPRAERRVSLERLAHNDPVIAIGTHALFQEHVHFARLGLVIIDEQHRFGVHQRLALLEKGMVTDDIYPHQMIMTATPIPRTLAMTLFADLDVSIIDGLPPGRKPVQTAVLSNERRPQIVSGLADTCAGGRQVYWVCPLIEESDALQCQAAVETQQQLEQQLPALRIGLVHGRMGSREKERAMRLFRSGGIDVLVATTVIEVGVDVPNASLMVIENAERLGLSQLHQLRGRVGRGARESDCLLLYQPPLSPLARTRLELMRNSTDGFEIAERDMQLRGPGELLGTRQAGLASLRIADLARDAGLIPEVQRAAEVLVASHAGNIEALARRWLVHGERAGAV